MAKGKVILGDYEMSGLAFIGLMIMLIVVSIILGVSMVVGNISYKECIQIPDSVMITSFCQNKGYEYGWLSSTSCGVNEVQCFKQIGNARYYDCININQAEGEK